MSVIWLRDHTIHLFILIFRRAMSKFKTKIFGVFFLAFIYGIGIFYFKDAKTVISMLGQSNQSVKEKISISGLNYMEKHKKC